MGNLCLIFKIKHNEKKKNSTNTNFNNFKHYYDGQTNNHIYEKEFIKENKLSAAVTEEVIIDANKEDVWKVISNWGEAYIYTPGLDKSHCTGEAKTGLQSKRHCDIGKGSVEEEVLLWEEGERFIQQV